MAAVRMHTQLGHPTAIAYCFMRQVAAILAFSPQLARGGRQQTLRKGRNASAGINKPARKSQGHSPLHIPARRHCAMKKMAAFCSFGMFIAPSRPKTYDNLAKCIADNQPFSGRPVVSVQTRINSAMADTANAGRVADNQDLRRSQDLKRQEPDTGPRRPFEGAVAKKPRVEIDREKVCPLLLRVFTKRDGHHTAADYAVRGKEPANEVQIYTWMDATLRELTDLVKEVMPDARHRDARLSFAFVYPDRRGRNVIRQVGKTTSIPRRSADEFKTLAELNFQTGDFLDVAVFL
eukprot:jgi/Mesvir1/18989/Mv18950-RA.1